MNKDELRKKLHHSYKIGYCQGATGKSAKIPKDMEIFSEKEFALGHDEGRFDFLAAIMDSWERIKEEIDDGEYD